MNSAPSIPAIQLDGVGKSYRLYSAPLYRVLDLLGLCPRGTAYWSEHQALRGITLTVPRGEKLAIIGRNGAGKSTLLKVITGALRPTHGSVRVNGEVSGLLQIGTGFHPDFTGRQNVFANFAHQGITGRRADSLFDEVVDFAELHEFIDQPMKTYSTGMTARLMFSAATVLEPDILVVDELLGVGDAYFSHKSYERMRALCAGHGTTLLLVTHDIYTAMSLCERFIWIDRGAILSEGEPKRVVAAYETSIKAQEEERLRSRARDAHAAISDSAVSRYRVRIASRSGFALSAPLALAELELEAEGASTRLNVATGAATERSPWTLLPESSLGPATTIDGRDCRLIEPRGGIFHKAEWFATISGGPPRALVASLHYDGAEAAEISLANEEGRVLLRRVVDGASGSTGNGAAAWRTVRFEVADRGANVEAADATGQYGTGLVRIESVRFRDAAGAETQRVKHGAALRVDVTLRASPELVERDVTLVVGFTRAGSAVGGYVHRERLRLPASERTRVDVLLDPLLFGSGTWLVTVGCAEPEFYRRADNPFFTVNARWHHLIARGHELVVESTDPIDSASFLVHPAQVTLSSASSFTPDVTPAQFVADDGEDPLRAWRDANPRIVRAIDEATEEVLALLPGASLDPLTRHQRALIGFDWRGYLSASRWRIQQLAWLLEQMGQPPFSGHRALDSGSYFGNFALALRLLGFEVTASDTYGDYGGALDPWRRLLERQGVAVVDPGDFSGGIPLRDGSFDVVISGGVIEHIPHSPKGYLLELARLVRPGGVVTIETPNLGYQVRRDALRRGESIYAPLAAQFDSTPPFAGHHREYTADEVEWMLRRVGLEPVRTLFMDYSHLSLKCIDETVAQGVFERRRVPRTQELVMVGARRT